MTWASFGPPLAGKTKNRMLKPGQIVRFKSRIFGTTKKEIDTIGQLGRIAFIYETDDGQRHGQIRQIRCYYLTGPLAGSGGVFYDFELEPVKELAYLDDFLN